MESSLAWRTPFIALTRFSIVFVMNSTLWLVPSRRWLILRGRQSEVSAAWDVLSVEHTEREKAEVELQVNATRQQDASSMRAPDSKTKHRFFDVFAQDVRSRTILAVFLLDMQQLSGIDGVLYVSSSKSTKPSF